MKLACCINGNPIIGHLHQRLKYHMDGIAATPDGFSRDELVVEIASAKVPNLAIVDLLGFLVGQNADPALRLAVEKVAVHYLRNRENVII